MTRMHGAARKLAAASAIVGGLLGATDRLPAQQPEVGRAGIAPLSDLQPDWLSGRAVSPDGRYVVVASYADDYFRRYDRSTGTWAVDRNVTLGTNVSWSPNGRFIAWALWSDEARARHVWVVPMDTTTGMPSGTARRVSALAGNWPVWSPDSRRIAFKTQDPTMFRLVVVPFNGGDEEVLYETPGVGGYLAWSPDGRFISSGLQPPGQPDRWLRVDVATRRAETFPAAARRLLGYSADGSRLAHYEPLFSMLVISSAATGQVLERVQLPRRVEPIAWSPTQPDEITAVEHILYSHIQRATLPGGAIEPLMPPAPVYIRHIRYSPDGRRIAFVQEGDTPGRVHVADSDGSNVRALGEGDDIRRIAWSPSGSHIAYVTEGAIGALRLIDVRTGADRILRTSKDGVERPGVALRWREDGQALQYVWRPRGTGVPDREAREITLDGKDRLLARFDTYQGEVQFINDTLLVVQKSTGVESLNVRTGVVRSLYSGATRGGGGFGVSPDGEWLAFNAYEGDSSVPTLLSWKTGATRRVPYQLGGELGTIDFHPDGRHLITSACMNCTAIEKWEILMLPINGEPARVLTASQPEYKDYNSIRVSPDGRHIVFEAEQSYNTRIVSLKLTR